MILVTEERSCWRTVARSAKSSTKKLSVEENLLQGVHRSRFRLSVEEGVLRNKRMSKKLSSGGRATENLQGRESPWFSSKSLNKICSRGKRLTPNRQIQENCAEVGRKEFRHFGVQGV